MSKHRNNLFFSKLFPAVMTAGLSLLAVLFAYGLFAQQAEATGQFHVPLVASALPAPSISYSSTVVVQDNGGDAGYMAATAIVNGKPAIAYFNSSSDSLMYVQAAEPNGNSWNEPIVIESDKGYLDYVNLIVTDGKPAIAFRQTAGNNASSAIKFAAATDADGSIWNSPITAADSAGKLDGWYLSMAIINGRPAISYQTNDPANANARSLRFVRANNGAGSSWGTPEIVDTTNVPGAFSSLATVNGKPAIAYYRQTGQDLFYIQAFDAAGNSWKTPVSVDSAGLVGIVPQLEVVNGQPAIAYQDLTNRDTKYIRATDVDGDNWGSPVSVDNDLSINGVYSAHLSMAMIDGKPAIVNTKRDTVSYFRAADSTGSSWAAPITLPISNTQTSQYMTLVVANGNPAVGFYRGSQGIVGFIQAADSSGNSWNNSVNATGGPVGEAVSTAIVNGHPAISFYSNRTGTIQYIRALDAEGNGWGPAVSVSAPVSEGNTYTSLAIINENPAIAYVDEFGRLKFVRANDQNGTDWGMPIDADSNANWGGSDVSLTTINGKPAIAYSEGNDSNLTYVQAIDANGTSWGTPIMVNSGDNTDDAISMITANGLPAIAFEDGNRLKYVQANDIDGNSWKAAVTVDSENRSGESATMLLINGKPAISYANSNSHKINFVEANDINGSGWLTPTIVLSNTNSSVVSMAIIDGRPALSFYDQIGRNLQFVHAEDTNGKIWGSAVTLDSDENTGWQLEMIPIGPYAGGTAYFDGELKRLKFKYFRYDKYELTVGTSGSGSGTVVKNPNLPIYDKDTMVLLTVAPDFGSTFTGWSGSCSGQQNCSVIMDSAKTVTATFTLDKFALDVTTAGNGVGNITRSPEASEYDFGTAVTLTATAETGSTFMGWSSQACVGDGCGSPGCSGSNPVCTLTIDETKAVTATFALKRYPLTTITTGSGSGTIERSPDATTYDHGAMVTLTAAADEGSTFVGWSGGGCSGTGNCTITMDIAKTVSGRFIDDTIGYQLFFPMVLR